MIRIVGWVAAFVGYCVRWLLALATLVPFALIVYGIWLFDYRVAAIVAGVMLFIMQTRDRRKA